MIDRNTPPPYITIDKVGLVPIQKAELNNGSPLYYITNSQLRVFRLELVFRAGSVFGNLPTDAYFTSTLLNSGTDTLDSAAITSKFESLGASFECTQGFEYFTVRLLGLSSYFEESVAFFKEVLFNAIFPEKELEIAINRQIQSYRIGLEKSDVVCNQQFKKRMFGEQSPYGLIVDEDLLHSVKQSQLRDFYLQKVQNGSYAVYLAGNVSSEQIVFVKSVFDANATFKETASLPNATLSASFSEKIEKEKAVQCSIKLGKPIIGRTHPDYAKFMLSNVLFGGYFGSRLMKNIREEKGLTYGISSSASPVGPHWIWSINSAVKKENIDIVLTEIEKELEILKTEVPSDEELQTVKNYISGSVLSGMNTVFDIIDKHRLIHQEGLSSTYYEDLLPAIHAVNADEVGQIAETYMTGLSRFIVG